jgi:signal transduction histidine kinase/ActR/RegA family two-component response regulator
MAQQEKFDMNGDVLRAARFDHELMAEIHHDQMEIVASRVRGGALGALFFSIVIAIYLKEPVGVAIWYWLALKAILAFLRLGLVFRWRSRKAAKPAVDKWFFWIRVTLFLDGAVLGSVVYLAQAAGASQEALLWVSAVLCGVTAVAMHTLESNWISSLLYGVPIVGQTVLYLALRGSAFGNGMALSVATFGAVLMINARRTAEDERQRIVQSCTIRRYKKQYEVALEMAKNESRMRAEVMSSITHELRTPIHGILAMGNFILKDPNSPSAVKAASMIIKSGEHLVELVNDVLDFGRFEAAGVTLKSEVFDLCDLVEELQNIGFMIGREKGVAFKVSSSLQSPHHVLADSKRLKQVALNLISNGIKFTGEGGKVTLQVERVGGGGTVYFRVIDNGEGIDPEYLNTIFEPFSRHAKVRNDSGLGGTGLGLSISKRIATAMKGTLEVESELGKGSTFTFTVPLENVIVSLQGAGIQKRDERPYELDGHALIAEDDVMVSQLTRSTLEMHGMTASVVDQGDMAVCAAIRASQRPDIVLMDGDMPGLDGLSSIRKIREHEKNNGLPHLPIVVVSGRCSSEDVRNAKKAGADDHLAKPYTNDDLLNMVALHLRSRIDVNRDRSA